MAEVKKVAIRLFKDSGNYSGDVFVAVNGESYQIQRGVTVEVPDYIAKVLAESQHQDEIVAEYIERETAKSAKKFKNLK